MLLLLLFLIFPCLLPPEVLPPGGLRGKKKKKRGILFRLAWSSLQGGEQLYSRPSLPEGDPPGIGGLV